MTMSELHALEMRGTQRDDKIKMQLTMHMSKIETRMQKLGARAVVATYLIARLIASYIWMLNALHVNCGNGYV